MPIPSAQWALGQMLSTTMVSWCWPARAATWTRTEPRRLPGPHGLCDLETGPETFQLVTSGNAQMAQLKKLAGKQVAVKVDEVACAKDPGIMSEAVITKWSVVQK